jgi:hypothetical protein
MEGGAMNQDEGNVLGDVARLPDAVWQRSMARVADDSQEADMSLIPDSSESADATEFGSDALDVDDPAGDDGGPSDTDMADDVPDPDPDEGSELDGWDE